MSKTEYISPEGFRVDGRKVGETRSINMRIGGVSQNADGSAYFEMGNTKAIAYVYGPWEVKRKRQHSTGRGVVNCKFVMASFSTMDWKKRGPRDR
jgi:exosome complex component RRP41